MVAYFEDEIIINDCLSACKNSFGGLGEPPSSRKTPSQKYRAELLSAGTGVETSEDTLFDFAKKVKNLERAYEVREGATRDTDSLPKRFMDHPIDRGEHKGSVLESSKFEEMKSKYYALRGWDIATGIPTRQTLEQTGLRDIAQDQEKRGKLRIPSGLGT